jgi:hypothetical protein
VQAYKFLRPGRIAPFSGFAWPEGEWVDGGGAELCVRGVHACRTAHLPYWIGRELWEIELAGAVREEPRKLVAERGRLVRRIDAWDTGAGRRFAEACAGRVRERADAGTGELPAYEEDAAANATKGEVAVVGYIAARAAEVAGGVDAYIAERDAQAAWLARELELR